MENKLKKAFDNDIALDEKIISTTDGFPTEPEVQILVNSIPFKDTFDTFYATVLLKKLRNLKTELRNQYAFNIEPTDTLKSPNIFERSIIIKSKDDNSLSKISIITYLEKEEFSIQGLPLYSKPSQLYNKTALIPFFGSLNEFDPEKFEGYIFQLLDYCFQ